MKLLVIFSKGSLYNYFENKEDLFLTTLEIGIQKLIEEMKAVTQNADLISVQIQSILLVMVKFFALFNRHG